MRGGFYGGRVLDRYNKDQMLKHLKEGKSDEWIRKQLNITPETYNKFKCQLYAEGRLLN